VRRARRSLALALAMSIAPLVSSARVAHAHPLHTTLVQLTYDERTHVIEASIRVFAGDFAAAVAKRAGAKTPSDDRVADAAAFQYVTNTLRISDAHGRMAPLTWCGSRRASDVLWLCVRAARAPLPAEVTLSDQMLCELFDDQINIVQTVAGTKRASMLFTKGDGAKRAMK
jgi:hypothetical protein